MKYKIRILMGLICIFVLLVSMTGCGSETGTSFNDPQGFYNSNGEVDEKAVQEYLSDNYGDDEVDTEDIFVTDSSDSSDDTENSGTYYILNTSSKKYHKSSCSFGKRTSEANKKISYESSSEIASQGYSPCGKCKP